MHEQFCVDDLWAFPLGRDNVCPQFSGVKNLVLTHTPRACEAPCQVLAQDQKFEFEVEPYPELRLPFTIKPNDLTSLNKGFNEGLGTEGPVWTKGVATIYFRSAPDSTDASQIRIRIYGSAIPDRPARIVLNEHVLGMVSAGHDVTEFTAPRDVLVAGENRLVIQVDNPQAVMGDPQNDFCACRIFVPQSRVRTSSMIPVHSNGEFFALVSNFLSASPKTHPTLLLLATLPDRGASAQSTTPRS